MFILYTGFVQINYILILRYPCFEDKRTLLTVYSVAVVYAQPNEIAYIPTILQFMFVMSQKYG